MEDLIVNKVKANTKLVTVDLAKLFDDDHKIMELDIKDFLHMGLLLKEKEFRAHLKEFDWTQYKDQILTVYCSTDAIIAPWAWMLITSFAKEYAKEVYHLEPNQVIHERYQHKMNNYNWEQYKDKFVLLKGCGDKNVPDSVYLMATNKLMPFAKKIMYGEACSFVPVWKAN